MMLKIYTILVRLILKSVKHRPSKNVLREMGTVNLLNRAKEVDIAKRIEEGTNQVQDAYLNILKQFNVY